MKVIGCYLLFIISLAGMSLSDDDIFSEENKKRFLDHIFDLHNMSRTMIRVQPLVRNDLMDEMAQNILKNKMFENIGRVPMLYGLNYYLGEYNNNTKLDDSEADFIFSGWYFERFTYIHPYDPRYLKAVASKQIVWKDTKEIGLALERTNDYYAVMVLYSPRYNTSTQGQYASNDSKPPIIDQKGPSTI